MHLLSPVEFQIQLCSHSLRFKIQHPPCFLPLNIHSQSITYEFNILCLATPIVLTNYVMTELSRICSQDFQSGCTCPHFLIQHELHILFNNGDCPKALLYIHRFKSQVVCELLSLISMLLSKPSAESLTANSVMTSLSSFGIGKFSSPYCTSDQSLGNGFTKYYTT